jgi:hypothetical protein
MKNEMRDLKSIAQSFLTAYDAHDVEGMLAVCADGALGRYAPYGRKSVVPGFSSRSRRDDPRRRKYRCDPGHNERAHAIGCPWHCKEG